MDDPLLSKFRSHVQVTFGVTGLRPPEWLLEGQIKAKKQIEVVGLQSKLRHLHTSLSSAAEKIDEPLEVFIVGEGKFGKSTLINALIGRELAPVDWEPKTWCFNRFIATEKPSSKVRIFVAPLIALRPELAQSLGRPHGQKRGLNEYVVSTDTAQKILQSEEDQIKTSGPKYSTPIMEMEWQVDMRKALLSNLRLVDTQGINQIHSDFDHQNYLKWQYERADAVLWLLTQERIGSDKTDQELRTMGRYAKPVILVLNKWDLIKNDPNRQLERARELYGNRVSAIVPFSARLAFLSVEPLSYKPTDKDMKLLREKGMDSWHGLREQSGIDRLLNAFQSVVDAKGARLRNMQTYSALREQQREYRRDFKHHQHDLEHNVAAFKRLQSLIDRTEAELLSMINSSISAMAHESTALFQNGLSALTHKNREEASTLLPIASIQVHMAEAKRKLERDCIARFSHLIADSRKPENQYRDSEFSAEGTVAQKNILDNIGDIDIVIDMNLSIQISLFPTGFWSGMFTKVGDFFKRFFASASEIREWDDNVRKEAFDQFIKSRDTFCERLQQTFISEVTQRMRKIRESVASRITTWGGVKTAETKIRIIEETMSQVAIPSVFVELPVRVMKKLDWPVAR